MPFKPFAIPLPVKFNLNILISKKPFDIYTDASNFQLGAVISQDTWPIAIYSRKLNFAQRKYTTMEKELLSIVETSQQYHHILLGSHYHFYSDHKNLGFNNFKLEHVCCWFATLEEFDSTFTSCPGEKNVIADMLSQYPMTPVTTSKCEEITTLDNNCFLATSENLKRSQDTIKGLHKKLSTNPNSYSTVHQNGIQLVCCKNKIIVDPKLFSDILAWYHVNLNHPGQDQTYKTINSIFYTPNMEEKVCVYSDNCQICKKIKHPTKKYGHLPESDLVCDPWEVIQIDLFGLCTFHDIYLSFYPRIVHY
jgi:RNase H-like domain found in reverse transcriptase/Integrase zinc binding domain